MTDTTITKRRVTGVNVTVKSIDPDTGEVTFDRHDFTDYVRPDFLDAYLADARTRWQLVTVTDEPDAGPAGYHGATHVPANLEHPLAGQTFSATTPEKD